MSFSRYDAATGKRRKPLSIEQPYETLTELAGLIDLPQPVADHLERVEALRARLGRPAVVAPSLPAPDAPEDEFDAYQRTVTRIEADSADRAKARAELANRRGATGPNNSAKVILANADEIIATLNEAAQKIIAKKTATTEDAETFSLLGRHWIATLAYVISMTETYDLGHGSHDEYAASAGARVEFPFTLVRLSFNWDAPAMLWAKPDDVPSTAVADPYDGIPSLADVKVLTAGDFRLASLSEAVAITRHSTALKYEAAVEAASARIKPLSGPFAVYLDKAIQTQGQTDPESIIF
ncbi:MULTISPECIES: hypothetical protein [Glycomyces]|uniref:Uncharacterized protein n=2 Tax=Glycomyces TaxID=58113 RepID=A0A9X3SVT9_9ACTN|nr:hypothetical protein [Glycomyces lechevalierae]MDA1386354.1 hypothetical protein [Glycomyces lechevalierae]MDR7338869.1 hypothetical protein [Glycomyces lechevalierae]